MMGDVYNCMVCHVLTSQTLPSLRFRQLLDSDRTLRYVLFLFFLRKVPIESLVLS